MDLLLARSARVRVCGKGCALCAASASSGGSPAGDHAWPPAPTPAACASAARAASTAAALLLPGSVLLLPLPLLLLLRLSRSSSGAAAALRPTTVPLARAAQEPLRDLEVQPQRDLADTPGLTALLSLTLAVRKLPALLLPCAGSGGGLAAQGLPPARSAAAAAAAADAASVAVSQVRWAGGGMIKQSSLLLEWPREPRPMLSSGRQLKSAALSEAAEDQPGSGAGDGDFGDSSTSRACIDWS